VLKGVPETWRLSVVRDNCSFSTSGLSKQARRDVQLPTGLGPRGGGVTYHRLGDADRTLRLLGGFRFLFDTRVVPDPEHDVTERLYVHGGVPFARPDCSADSCQDGFGRLDAQGGPNRPKIV
jgi:hypothetical protein